ncbi:MAG: hypothetical protein Q9M43_10665 [Sulfurimonas sp.]|nr:hypothetical protein [Sulfurimonas sp.]
MIDNELVSSFARNNIKLDGEKFTYKDGDNSLTIADGSLAKFFEVKPHLLKAKGNDGEGSGAGGSGNSGGNNQDFIP